MPEHAAKKWQRFFATGILRGIVADQVARVLTLPSEPGLMERKCPISHPVPDDYIRRRQTRAPRERIDSMSTPGSRIFDDLGRLMTDAAGVASGVRREAESLVKSQMERFVRDMDVVSREEFEAVREMAVLAREENEALKARIEALEAKLAG
jgi:BMFP domain-containing protein YqiC